MARQHHPRRMAALAALALLSLPSGAAARCAPFDLFEAIGEIPIVIVGRVEASNAALLGGGRCLTEPCPHEARVEVLEVLKGEVDRPEVIVRLDYVEQRPQIALFPEGTTYVFALGEVSAAGVATLFGTTCGRSGVGTEELDHVRRSIAASH